MTVADWWDSESQNGWRFFRKTPFSWDEEELLKGTSGTQREVRLLEKSPDKNAKVSG